MSIVCTLPSRDDLASSDVAYADDTVWMRLPWLSDLSSDLVQGIARRCVDHRAAKGTVCCECKVFRHQRGMNDGSQVRELFTVIWEREWSRSLPGCNAEARWIQAAVG